ncbi:glycerophosphodiester phosphodiesterase [Halosolutus amylolyticus]|uniref:Glycerophosphodiester phosphodiesterase n=1 Tax=Halosolutus amylolyticus TaxID=2932267 RepID=A0ABD5PUY6_9EURY|nr:glycerophosphodiester phosphodiesterase [Halosolutus amylolyticus]
MSFSSRPDVSRRRLLAGMGAGVSGVAVWGLSPLIGSGSVTSDRPQIVGHRGAEGLAPPNTEAAIRRALEVGVDGVELDVRRTSDGELLLFHDPVLDWDSTGHGWIRNTPWDEIEGAQVDGEPLVTLDRALETIAPSDASIYLELKDGGYTDAVLETVAEHGLTDRTTIIAFDAPVLDPAQGAGVSTGLVGSVPTPWLAEDAAAAGADAAFTHYAPHGVPTFVDETRERGLTAGVWKLVDTKETIRDVLEHDLDVLVTNRPDFAFDVLQDA